MEDAKGLGSKHDELYRSTFDQNVAAEVKDFALKSHRKKGRKRIRQVDDMSGR